MSDFRTRISSQCCAPTERRRLDGVRAINISPLWGEINRTASLHFQVEFANENDQWKIFHFSFAIFHFSFKPIGRGQATLPDFETFGLEFCTLA